MKSLQEAGSPINARKWKIFCFALLLLAGSEFAIRGPIRAIRTATGFNDFLSPYIQADAWRHARDPYSPQVLLRLWPAQARQFYFLPREVALGTLVANRGIPTAYPVTALVLIAPFTLLPWKAAYAVWMALTLGLFVFMVAALRGITRFSWREPGSILLIAGVLALAPFHTAIVTANVTLLAVELSVIAIFLARRQRELPAGCLLALAAGFKPQIGLCFILYYLIRGRWKLLGAAISILACLAATGLLWLAIAHTPWRANYMNDNRVLLQTGVLGNFTPMNGTRFGLINLQVALYPMIGRAGITNGLAEAIGAALLATWFVLVVRRESSDQELLELSAIAVISLLPVYHRFYDATLLVLPLAWAMVSLRKYSRRAIFSVLLMMLFLIPGGTILQNMQEDGRIPQWLMNHWWWQVLVMSHQIWALLALSIVLLYQMYAAQGKSAFRGGFR